MELWYGCQGLSSRLRNPKNALTAKAQQGKLGIHDSVTYTETPRFQTDTEIPQGCIIVVDELMISRDIRGISHRAVFRILDRLHLLSPLRTPVL